MTLWPCCVESGSTRALIDRLNPNRFPVTRGSFQAHMEKRVSLLASARGRAYCQVTAKCRQKHDKELTRLLSLPRFDAQLHTELVSDGCSASDSSRSTIWTLVLTWALPYESLKTWFLKLPVPLQQRLKPNMSKLHTASSSTAVGRTGQERGNMGGYGSLSPLRCLPRSLALCYRRAIPPLWFLYPFPPGGLLTWPCWSSSLLVSLTFSKDTICFSSCSPVKGESGCTYNLKNTGKRPAHKNLTSWLVPGHDLCTKWKSP